MKPFRAIKLTGRSGTDLHFLNPQPDTSLHCKPWIWTSASRGVSAYVSAFARIHYA